MSIHINVFISYIREIDMRYAVSSTLYDINELVGSIG